MTPSEVVATKMGRHPDSRAIEAAQVIEELIQLAKDMRAARARGDDALGSLS